MADLIDYISDYFPPASGVSVPLQSDVWVQFSVEMDTDRLEEDFFVTGPDTDQFIGPFMAELVDPDNVSQGDLDDFLRSPGYTGVVQGEFSFVTVSGVSTKLIFSPTNPLAPSTTYSVFIGDTLDADGNTLSGDVTWWFETGTGSIQELPSNISSSILASSPQALAQLAAQSPLSIVKTIPADHSVENDVDLTEIVIEFNKNLDSDSITDDNVTVETTPATDHPNASVTSEGELAKDLVIEGNRLKIKV